MREREVKLSADEEFRLPDLGGLLPGIAVSPREDEHLSTDYWDSDDVRLARWGLSLRHRWAAHTTSVTGAFAAGELAARQRAAAYRVRARWRHAWKRVKAAAPA